MRDIYVRHRPRCRYAQADYKGAKKRPSRQIFGCGCPIYARVEIRDTTTKDLLFEHNGSLKGVTAKEAAEELVNTWFVKYLSGETPPIRKSRIHSVRPYCQNASMVPTSFRLRARAVGQMLALVPLAPFRRHGVYLDWI
jgi:hypothetical protein